MLKIKIKTGFGIFLDFSYIPMYKERENLLQLFESKICVKFTTFFILRVI